MIELDNRVALLAIVVAAILAAGLTALVQPIIAQNLIATTGQPTSISTITSTAVSTTTILTSTRVTNTSTITTATTSISTVTATSTITITSTVTTTVTATKTITTTTTAGAPSGNASATPQTTSIDLISIQNGKAASWSKTTLSILITTNSAAASTPDLQAVNAAGGAISQWRSAIAQFTKNYTQYTYLNKLTFKIYVQGVNDTALKSNPDIRISFTDTLPSLLGDTKLLILNTPLISSVNTTVAVQGLNTQGVQNVLVHEFGHALGLNHTSIETDAMYGERERTAVSEEKLCPSTLDLYALTSIYQWIPKGIYLPYSGTSITLPQNISYQTVACGQ